MRWFLVAGCIGLLVAGGLTLGRNQVPPHLLLVLWPSSIVGMVFTGPPKWDIYAILLVFVMYGGNFLLYGVVGASRISDEAFRPRVTLVSSEAALLRLGLDLRAVPLRSKSRCLRHRVGHDTSPRFREYTYFNGNVVGERD